MEWFDGFPKFMSVRERRERAEAAARKLGAKRKLEPVAPIEGPLAVTWWGRAWNRNLESYSDYANRLPRGRSYVRHGAVIHLALEPGRASGLVQGSRAKPYAVEITIKPMGAPARASLVSACAGRLESAEALLSGSFPEDLERLLTAEKTGLFPHPEAIGLACSCPDSATMCKHVAAVLYGVGARLDRDPSLFFRLRGVAMEDLVSRAVRRRADSLLKAKGRGESARLRLGDSDLGRLFGVDFGPVPRARNTAKLKRKK